MMKWIFIFALLAGARSAGAAQDQPLTAAERECLLRLAASGGDELTLGEMRANCTSAAKAPAPATEASPDTAATEALEQRLRADRVAADQPFTILAHRPNYVLPAVYNHDGWDATLQQQQSGDPTLVNEDVEFQFQLSIKTPIALGLFDDRIDLYAAYTNRSFWQVYNDEQSQPFRETNHEPEVWAQWENDWSFLGYRNTLNAIGYVHQSNGQSGILSRSWDRLFANFIFTGQRFGFSVRPWVWLNEGDDDSDNPDIDDYMGHGEIRLGWYRNDQLISIMLRNQVESGFDQGAVEVSWSFPLFDYPYVKGYVQYFYGYGESLIDYDQRVNRIGLGIALTDWLN